MAWSASDMILTPVCAADFSQLMTWIDSERMLRQWGGPLFNFPLTREQLAAHYAETMVAGFILRVAGDYGGFVERYRVSETECRLCRVWVAPQLRGTGVGKAMLGLVMRQTCQQTDIRRFVLGVFAHNHPARRCYESLGFTPYAWESASMEVDGESWDLIRMACEITP